jgi:hypothetical protein
MVTTLVGALDRNDGRVKVVEIHASDQLGFATLNHGKNIPRYYRLQT